MAMISTGKGSSVQALARWSSEAHTKQAPVLRASQQRRTFARTAAGFIAVSQQEAACPRWWQTNAAEANGAVRDPRAFLI